MNAYKLGGKTMKTMTIMAMLAISAICSANPGMAYINSFNAALYRLEGEAWYDGRNAAEDSIWHSEPERYYDGDGRHPTI